MGKRGGHNGRISEEVRLQYIGDCKTSSLAELAKKYNISIRGASARRRVLCGIVLCGNKVRAGKNNPSFGRRELFWVNKSMLKKFKRMYGINRNIAKKLNVSLGTVSKAMGENGVWYKNGRTDRTKIPKCLLEKLYAKGFDLKKIGRLLNIDDNSVARTFHQYGIKYQTNTGWKRTSEMIESKGLSSLRREAEFKWEIGQREKIRDRDNHKCFVCGCGEDGEKSHHVHHILWDTAYSEDRHLVTMCHSCHSKTNSVSKVQRALWIYFFTKRLSEVYGYIYDDMIEGGERVGKVIASR